MPGPSNLQNQTIAVIAQSTVVPMLNLYLQANKIDLKANETGICNGLAAVYCRYALEGKEAEFLAMLRYIERKGEEISYAQKHGVPPPPSTDNELSTLDDSKVNKFIGEVIFTYLPKEFDKRLNQDDSIQFLKFLSNDGITTKQAVKEYNIGLVANVADWGRIFDKLKAEDTAWTVGTPTHAISVSVKNGQFRVYDPSHNKLDICQNGKELAKLLSTIFPEKDKAAKLLPLTINICSHPDKPSNHQYPTKELIFKNLLKKDPGKINQFVEINGNKFDSLAMAVLQNDIAQIRLSFLKGATNPEVAFKLAARDNRLQALDVLLEEEHRKLIKDPDKVYVEACRLALEVGRYEAFEKLIQDEKVNHAFYAHLSETKNQVQCLNLVAGSGNPQCIKQLVEYYTQNIVDVDIPGLIKSSKAVDLAEKSGNRRSVETLCNYAGIEVPESQQKFLVDFPSNDEETNIFIAGFRSFVQFIGDTLQTMINLFSRSAEKQETGAYANASRFFKQAPENGSGPQIDKPAAGIDDSPPQQQVGS